MRADGGEVVRLVQRGERHQPFQRRKRLCVDQYRLAKMFAAMDHSMAGADELPVLMFAQPVEQPCQSRFMRVGAGGQVPGERVAGRIAGAEGGRCAQPGNDSLELGLLQVGVFTRFK